MASRRANQTFGFALGLSLALHVMFLLTAPNPAAVPVAQRRAVVPVRLVSSSVLPPASQPEEPKKPEPKDIDLGLDAPLPPSRTWLGFTEYLKQLAAKGSVDQAAFTDEPIAAAPPPAPPSPPMQQIAPSPPAQLITKAAPPTPQPNAPEPMPVQDPDPSDSPTPAARTAAQDDSSAEDLNRPPPIAAPALPEPITSDALAKPRGPGAPDLTGVAESDLKATEESPPSNIVAALAALVDQARSIAADAAAAKQRAARNAQAQPPTPALASAPPPSPPQQAQPSEKRPAIAPRPTDGAESVGARSDRESDPISVLEVPQDQWRLGKPLAAHGLEIKPRRPTMTILTELTSWPRNPLCKIGFDSTGVPKRAVILQSTGDSRVDSAIEASLYRWRATGKELESLREGETVDLTIRLVINPERKHEDEDPKG